MGDEPMSAAGACYVLPYVSHRSVHPPSAAANPLLADLAANARRVPQPPRNLACVAASNQSSFHALPAGAAHRRPRRRRARLFAASPRPGLFLLAAIVLSRNPSCESRPIDGAGLRCERRDSAVTLLPSASPLAPGLARCGRSCRCQIAAAPAARFHYDTYRSRVDFFSLMPDDTVTGQTVQTSLMR